MLSYNRLVKLVEDGVINADPKNINGCSIDVTLDEEILVEKCPGAHNEDVCVLEKNNELTPHFYSPAINFESVKIPKKPLGTSFQEYFFVKPGQFFLASTVETFNLPNTIACQFFLKSSQARNGLQHLMAGFCDPGWSNSKLTLEFKNVTQHHNLGIRAGMKIGQVVFHEVDPVPTENSYAKHGQYSNQTGPTASKGAK